MIEGHFVIAYNSFFFCKKDLLKCCNICDSEDLRQTYYKDLQPVYTLEK